jgi:hypothetical protein
MTLDINEDRQTDRQADITEGKKKTKGRDAKILYFLPQKFGT